MTSPIHRSPVSSKNMASTSSSQHEFERQKVCLSLSGRHVREKRAEALCHCRVCDDSVAKLWIWQVRDHRGLNHGHDLAGLSADHRKAENAVVARTDKNLHKALRFVRRCRPAHRLHRQPRNARGHTLALRFALAQSDMSEGRVREHAVRNQAIARAAVAAGEIVPDDAKVILGCVRELRAAGAFADSPDIGGRRLQPLIDANVATSVQLDAGLFEPDAGGIGNASCRGQDIAAFDLLLTGWRTRGKADLLSGSALYIEGFGSHQNLNTFVTENSLHFVGDVGILTGHQLRPGLADRHAAAEAVISLGHFETDIATAEHDQM